VLIDPLHGGRQFGARCPECDQSYRLSARTFRADHADVRVVVWALVLPSGATVLIPPMVEGLYESNAPLFQDVPWASRWPMDPRRPGNGPWSLPRVSVDEVRRDGYAATLQSLAIDADWPTTDRNRHLIHVIDPVVVHGVTVIDPGEVCLAQRGWLRVRPDAVVLAEARSVIHPVVVSRGFVFVDRPLDINLTPPQGEQRSLFVDHMSATSRPGG
jgi:hypothetical protein